MTRSGPSKERERRARRKATEACSEAGGQFQRPRRAERGKKRQLSMSSDARAVAAEAGGGSRTGVFRAGRRLLRLPHGGSAALLAPVSCSVSVRGFPPLRRGETRHKEEYTWWKSANSVMSLKQCTGNVFFSVLCFYFSLNIHAQPRMAPPTRVWRTITQPLR